MIPHPVAAQATCSPGAEPAAGRILIVGGEPGIRSLIGGALAAAGYVTDLASTGTEGLRRALECHYDLIILDLGTLGPDGRDVLARMLSARPGQAVIVLSCLSDVAARVDCLERGAQTAWHTRSRLPSCWPGSGSGFGTQRIPAARSSRPGSSDWTSDGWRRIPDTARCR